MMSDRAQKWSSKMLIKSATNQNKYMFEHINDCWIVLFLQGTNHSSEGDLVSGRPTARTSNRAAQLTFQRCEVFTQQ